MNKIKNKSSHKVLIFGVSGFVGKYLVDEFAAHGYEIFGSDIVNGGYLPDSAFYSTDLLNYEAVEKTILSIDPNLIVNLAAISSVGESWNRPQATIRINVIGALNIMETLRIHKPDTKLLLVGSSEEYVISNYPMSEERPLDATNPYGISKVTQEQFAKMYKDQYGLRIYCVRAFNHTGIGQRVSFVLPSWCKQVAEIDRSGKRGCIGVGNITVKRDFSHVRDIVKAYRMIIESDDCSVIYNVGSGRAYSLKEILEYIIGLSDQTIDVEIQKERIRPTDQPMICCDYSLIKSQLGWEPEYSVFDALDELFSFYRRGGGSER